MATRKSNTRERKNGSTTTANLGFEAQLWAAADALRNNMDEAEYQHVVLGLIFLKYISDAFESKHVELEAQKRQGADPEDPDEYRAKNIFWVPKEARWSHLKASVTSPPSGRWWSATTHRSSTSCPRPSPALASTSSGSARSSIW